MTSLLLLRLFNMFADVCEQMLLCTEIIASSILDLISKQARLNAAVRTSFFLTPNVWLLQLNLVNFYLHIKKRSDID